MITSLTILRDVLESAAYAAQIVGVIVLLYAAYSYLLQRQQLNFDVMTSCTARFQNILPLLHFEVREERDKGEERYVDLCNEQLFYFANDYLPPEVIEEWPDGMVLYLPHHDGEKWISGHGAGAVGKEKREAENLLKGSGGLPRRQALRHARRWGEGKVGLQGLRKHPRSSSTAACPASNAVVAPQVLLS